MCMTFWQLTSKKARSTRAISSWARKAHMVPVLHVCRGSEPAVRSQPCPLQGCPRRAPALQELL